VTRRLAFFRFVLPFLAILCKIVQSCAKLCIIVHRIIGVLHVPLPPPVQWEDCLHSYQWIHDWFDFKVSRINFEFSFSLLLRRKTLSVSKQLNSASTLHNYVFAIFSFDFCTAYYCITQIHKFYNDHPVVWRLGGPPPVFGVAQCLHSAVLLVGYGGGGSRLSCPPPSG